jgi:hypothetical protein
MASGLRDSREYHFRRVFRHMRHGLEPKCREKPSVAFQLDITQL